MHLILSSYLEIFLILFVKRDHMCSVIFILEGINMELHEQVL